ncbi:hypothetical protein ACFL1D_00020 [Candidatus Omnitrophota bacterium]
MAKRAQIATIITLAIAAIFLFIVVTINIGQIAQKKTAIDNACDGAGLLLASGLGSMATGIKQQMEMWGDSIESCEFNWSLIIGCLIIIASIVVTICTLATASAITGPLIAQVALGLVMGGATGGFLVSEGISAAHIDPQLVQALKEKFQNMSTEQRLTEAAIQFALFATVTDQDLVPDRFDADRDGNKFPGTLDKISRFNHWYFQRLDSLPRIGDLVDDFYEYLFGSPQFHIVPVPQTGDAHSVHLLVNGNWRITDWLAGEFKSFIVRLWSHGYGVEFADDYTKDLTFFDPADPDNGDYENDELGQFYRDIRLFEIFAKGIYNTSKEDLVGSFETWMNQFDDLKAPTDDFKDWYDHMLEWEAMLQGWIAQLAQRQNEILACVNSCSSPGPWTCGPGGGGCCAGHVEYDEYSWWCVCDAYAGCGGGRGCCQLCSSSCLVENSCNTPTGGVRGCCSSACPLYIQNCAMGRYCSGGGICASAACDNYYNCGCNNDSNRNTIIPPFIARLQLMQESIESLRTRINEVALEAASRKDEPWVHEAIYVWKDVVLDEFSNTVQKESPAHMVYVRLDVPQDFKLPYLTVKRRNWGFRICQRIEWAEEEFDLTVARYDEDLAKRGPLSNFWRFRFRRNAALAENADVTNLLRPTADRFMAFLNNGDATTLEQLLAYGNPSDPNTPRARLVNLAMNHGIVAKATFHYGPGYTYKPDELPGEAAKRTKDIYIKKRHR